MVMKNMLGMNEKGLREYWVEQTKALPQHCSQPAQNHRGLVTLELPGPYVHNPPMGKGQWGMGQVNATNMHGVSVDLIIIRVEMNNPEYN